MIQGIMETAFDLAYLCTVITLGVLMLKGSRGRRQVLLFGAMAVTLGVGDAFHLVPRAYALLTDGLAHHTAALGTGKFITSITMTLFYVLLYHVWRARYGVRGRGSLTVSMYALAALRIILCLFPQNGWTAQNPPLEWAIARNIPFAAMGVLIIVLFFRSAKQHNEHAFRHMWLTIVLSFAFYLPVVLFADRYPAVGILMIPKTCAYIWTVWIGYRDMRLQDRREN